MVSFLLALCVPALSHAQECPPDRPPVAAVSSAVEAGLRGSPPPVAGVCTIDPASVTGPAADQIHSLDPRTVVTLPVLFQPAEGPATPVALFQVTRRDGSTRYVDGAGRRYTDLADWTGHNVLPEGRVTFPADGSCAGARATAPTPASTFSHKAGVWGDRIAMAGGIALGVAALAGATTVAIPIAGAVLAGYGLYRAGGVLLDRFGHGQSVNPITDGSARMAWIGLAASAVGVGAMGSTARAATLLAREGTAAGTSAALVAAHLQVASQVTNAVAVGDLGAELAAQWPAMDGEQRTEALGQLVFSAGMLGWQVRQAGGLPDMLDAEALHGQLIAEYAADAAPISEPMMATLQDSFRKLGLNESPATIREYFALQKPVPDGEVEALLKHVLADPSYAPDVQKTLARYSAEALAHHEDTVEAKMLRLQMLLLAAPQSTRPALMAAVRADLATGSSLVKQALSQRTLTVDRIIVGGGPQGSTIANELNRVGAPGGTLVVDASAAGDGNFGSLRNFKLNSTSGRYDGAVGGGVEGRTGNPLFRAPLAVEDLEPFDPENPFPNAGTFGDASTIALDAARRGGANVLVRTKVVDVQRAPANSSSRYEVTLADLDRPGTTYRVRTSQLVDATGLGAPAVPIDDAATRAYVAGQTDRLLRGGPSALAHQSVLQGEDLLRVSVVAHGGEVGDFVRRSDGNVLVVGGGDAAKTHVEALLKEASDEGTTLPAMLGGRRIDWAGADPSKISRRYDDLSPLFQSGAARPVAGRVTKIVPVEGTTRSSVTFTMSDGSTQTREYGRVILAMGMKAQAPQFLKGLAPSFDPKTDRVPVMGQDPAYPGTPLASQLVVNGHPEDVYFVGVASGLERPLGSTFLQYFGWKNLLFADQALVGVGATRH